MNNIHLKFIPKNFQELLDSFEILKQNGYNRNWELLTWYFPDGIFEPPFNCYGISKNSMYITKINNKEDMEGFIETDLVNLKENLSKID